MANTSKKRLRLKFNFRTKETEVGQIRTYASTLVEDVAMESSDELWKTVQGKIARRLENDAYAEIAKMAQLYKQYIIGIGSEMVGARGTLTPRSKFAEGSDYASLNYKLQTGPAGRWPARGQPGIGHLKKRNGDYYLPWKKRRVGHQRWFEHTGVLGSVMGSAANWTTWFGSIRVDVQRTDSQSLADAQRLAEAQPSRTMRTAYLDRYNTGLASNTHTALKVQVANIRVEAMRNITPEMLPALLSGDINDVQPDGRKTGLIGLLPPQIAQHIAGSSQPKNFVPYRHTLEPFLGFVLTKAIPNAVMRRIEDGLGANIRFYADKADRFEKFTDYSGL